VPTETPQSALSTDIAKTQPASFYPGSQHRLQSLHPAILLTNLRTLHKPTASTKSQHTVQVSRWLQSTCKVSLTGRGWPSKGQKLCLWISGNEQICTAQGKKENDRFCTKKQGNGLLPLIHPNLVRATTWHEKTSQPASAPPEQGPDASDFLGCVQPLPCEKEALGSQL
jgi:hypothetical protein